MHTRDASALPAGQAGSDAEGDASRRVICYSVPKTASLLGIDPMTLYRAIAAGEFPAIKVRGRLAVPFLALEQIIGRAMTTGAVVDVAGWCAEGRPNGGGPDAA